MWEAEATVRRPRAASTISWSQGTPAVFGLLLRGDQEQGREISYSTRVWHFCHGCQEAVHFAEHHCSPEHWGIGGY